MWRRVDGGPGNNWQQDVGATRVQMHFSGIKIMALCVALLALLAPTLAGCRGCSIVYGNSTGLVFALRASDGSVLWQTADVPQVEPTAPVVDGQTVVVSAAGGLVEAWRATDGKPLWRSQPLSGISAPSSNTLFAALHHRSGNGVPVTAGRQGMRRYPRPPAGGGSARCGRHTALAHLDLSCAYRRDMPRPGDCRRRQAGPALGAPAEDDAPATADGAVCLPSTSSPATTAEASARPAAISIATRKPETKALPTACKTAAWAPALRSDGGRIAAR